MVFKPTTRTVLKTAIDAIYGSSPTLTEASEIVEDNEYIGEPYGAIDTWNVSLITAMNNLFLNMTFDEPINSWSVELVNNFTGMFHNSTFNQDISGWSVVCCDGINSMYLMFSGNTVFNQDISGWNVEHVDNFGSMFSGATAFNTDLRPWGNQGNGPQSTAVYTDMFLGATAFEAAYGPSGANLNYYGDTPSYLYFDVNNTCLPVGTLVSLDQGDIEIQKIDTNKHTLNGQAIIAVSRSTPSNIRVVRVEKDAFAPNVPSQTFECSLAHEIVSPLGKRQTAQQWVNDEKITMVPNTHKDLYNIVLKTHQTMMIYNLEVETLAPRRRAAHKAIFRKQEQEKQKQEQEKVVQLNATE
jgi:hypothetical protein